MSRWSHVAGVIRIDALPLHSNCDVEWVAEVEKNLGKIVLFNSPRRLWDLPITEKTPMGSEGGIQYTINLTGNKNSLTRGTITIFADLRDFGSLKDTKTIVSWLNNAFEKIKSCYIRQAIIQVEDEGKEGNGFIIWDDDKGFIFYPTSPTTSETQSS